MVPPKNYKEYKIPKKTYFYDPVNINLSYEDSIKLESLKEINLKNAKSLSYNGLKNLSDTTYGEDDSCDCCKSADDKHLFEFKYLPSVLFVRNPVSTRTLGI